MKLKRFNQTMFGVLSGLILLIFLAGSIYPAAGYGQGNDKVKKSEHKKKVKTGFVHDKEAFERNKRNEERRDDGYRRDHRENYDHWNDNHAYDHRRGHGPRFRVLPAGHTLVHINGQKFYYQNGWYYWPDGSEYYRMSGPVGASITIMPGGYKRIYVGNTMYYYLHGTYYQYDRPRKLYFVVEPPIGAQVVSIPEEYDRVYMGSIPYYHYNGSYYKYDPRHKVYILVNAPIGLELSVLPFGCKMIMRGNNKYYSYGSVYYEPVRRNGGMVFRVVRW